MKYWIEFFTKIILLLGDMDGMAKIGQNSGWLFVNFGQSKRKYIDKNKLYQHRVSDYREFKYTIKNSLNSKILEKFFLLIWSCCIW